MLISIIATEKDNIHLHLSLVLLEKLLLDGFGFLRLEGCFKSRWFSRSTLSVIVWPNLTDFIPVVTFTFHGFLFISIRPGASCDVV